MPVCANGMLLEPGIDLSKFWRNIGQSGGPFHWTARSAVPVRRGCSGKPAAGVIKKTPEEMDEMGERDVTTIIDPTLCTGCGLCVRVCPDETISMRDGKAVVTGNVSLHCGHCAAVCPADAIRVSAIDPAAQDFATFHIDDHWIDYGQADVCQLVRLMRSRRSCRNFEDRCLSRDLLEDLVKIGITAPSGTNSQKWTFTILPDRNAVLDLGRDIGRFFRRLNRLAEKTLLRKAFKVIGKPALENYYRDYHDVVADALQEWDSTGRDRLFHGAPAVIIVGSRPGASCPGEDALLASQNMLLAAHCMGLGTCLVGFAVTALQQEPKIKLRLGVPADERIYAVVAIGYPDEVYQRATGRKMPVIRYCEASKE
jgi:nitroreductase/Pyruvate/2-oxoacid:ferredoxin oxidoreductase delta subunit